MVKKVFRCFGRVEDVREFVNKLLQFGVRPIEVRVVENLHEVVLSEEAFEYVMYVAEKDPTFKQIVDKIYKVLEVVELPSRYVVAKPVFETFHIALTVNDVGKEIVVKIVDEGSYVLLNLSDYSDVLLSVNSNYLIFGKALIFSIFAEPKPDVSIPDYVGFTLIPPKFDIKFVKDGGVVKLFSELTTRFNFLTTLTYAFTISDKLINLTQNVYITHVAQFITPKALGETKIGLVVPLSTYHSWRNVLKELIKYFTEPIEAPVEICLDTSTMYFSCGSENCWNYINKLHIIGDITLYKSHETFKIM